MTSKSRTNVGHGEQLRRPAKGTLRDVNNTWERRVHRVVGWNNEKGATWDQFVPTWHLSAITEIADICFDDMTCDASCSWPNVICAYMLVCTARVQEETSNT